MVNKDVREALCLVEGMAEEEEEKEEDEQIYT